MKKHISNILDKFPVFSPSEKNEQPNSLCLGNPGIVFVQ